jgi:general L-amino acid transport system substrate-binding protein
MEQMRKFIAFLALALTASATAASAASPTLDAVKARGVLNCGVNTGLAGFAAPDDKGEWTGIDADFCRAVAAAIFKDATKIRFVPLNAKERFTALQSGEIDLLSRNTTWTMSRDTSLGMNFTGVMYYDGQVFMVRKSLGLKSVKELGGASICVQTGTTNEQNLADFFATTGMTYRPVVFERLVEVMAAYNSGRCDAFTTDSSQVISERTRLPVPDDHVILPELISKEPLGPVVRQGDAEWANIVRWTHFAMLNAEELGVTRANVDEMKASPNPEIRRLLGVDGEFGKGIGLDNDWAAAALRAVGNYGESFDRNLGMGSRLKIERGRNALWKDGGLMYAPPIR